jgi:hypothetical protein
MSTVSAAELQLLAARAEASVDASLGTARYTSLRNIEFVHDRHSPRVGASSSPFAMSAISADVDGRPRDVILCRTPELAKFIVALLEFGGSVVASAAAVIEDERGYPVCLNCGERHAYEQFTIRGFPATTCPYVAADMLVMRGADGSSTAVVKRPPAALFFLPPGPST